VAVAVASISGLLVTSNLVEARDFRPARIPNGTVFSCSNCHINPLGGGPRTPFGEAVFSKIGGTTFDVPFWDSQLAGMDSDGDGYTNGQELGDPDGDFQNIGPASAVTNPGNASSKPNMAPGFTSSPITTATVGVLYTYQATALDFDGDSISFSKVVGPTWINVTTGGLVSGTPPVGSGGGHSITIRVTDTGSPPKSADQSYTLNVTAPNQAPSFTSSPVTTAAEGEPYAYQATASDPDGNPVTFAKVGGPAWINVSSSGAVTGTPPSGSAGTVAVSLSVSDNGSPALTATQAYDVAVAATFASWQSQNFNLPAEASIAGPDQDPDGDGLFNLIEYALKTSAKTPNSVRLMEGVSFDAGGHLVFSHAFRDDDPRLSVIFETSAGVPFTLNVPTQVEAVITDPAANDGVKTWTFTDVESKNSTGTRYGRLRFELAP